MVRATGLHYRELWELRALALRRSEQSRSGLFIWMMWNADEAKKWITLKDEDAARPHVKEHEERSGFA